MLYSPADFRPFECWIYGSECDGIFARYPTTPAADTRAVHCDGSDVELASVPCSYSTAEGMLHRIQVIAQDRILITGASGGVSSTAVQLAKCRGAEVIALAVARKAEQLRNPGVDRVIVRTTELVEA